jgi:hypothetical protein
MIYWNQNCIIYILKSNEGLRYERYILFIRVLIIKVFPIINHVFEFNFSKEWSLKCYSITKFKLFFKGNLHFKNLII